MLREQVLDTMVQTKGFHDIKKINQVYTQELDASCTSQRMIWMSNLNACLLYLEKLHPKWKGIYVMNE